ncbi:MAG: TIGR03790 family protein [Verrucomicrobia bacterium]|nr:TIGR03790 family protein [Verrucomicrobiota bacterium]
MLATLLFGLPGFPARSAEPGASAVVVFNSRLAESKEVAAHYAKLRQVPDKQVLGLDLPTTETMTRAEFKKQLQTPLYDELVAKGFFKLGPPEAGPDGASQRRRVLHSSIRYLVLCYGVPLKIPHDDTLAEEGALKLQPELRKNGAAVDSELVLLPLGRDKIMLAGLVPNPFYGTAVTNLPRIQATNGVLLVARLDGPTPAIARGLVDKAMEAEKYGLWGRAYFDARGLTNGSYLLGDEWIRGAAKVARQMGFETVLDDAGAVFSDTFPLSDVALYAGWYEGDACGPFALPEVELMPGALAYHLHSFSAATLRSTTQHWAGPLLAKGATATVGYTDEPYLSATSDIAVLLRNFLHGASFGEAAWSAERGFSWQTTVVGDPLYRPCDVPLDRRHFYLESHFSRLVEWSHLLVVNRNLVMNAPADETLAYLRNIEFMRHSAVLTEKLGDLLRLKKELPQATEAYQQALQRYPSPQQKVRLLLAIADLQTSAGRDKDAVQTLQQFLKECPRYPGMLSIYQRLLPLAEKLRDTALVTECQAMIQKLTPPPPPPPATK